MWVRESAPSLYVFGFPFSAELGICPRACLLPWFSRKFSGGGLAPPASPGRRRFLWGDNLTQPRRHRSLVEDCRRALKTVNPRLVWSFDSRRHRDLRVRAVVERTMEEEAGSNRELHRPDLRASLQGPASIEASWTSMASSLDLISSTEVLTSILELTQASTLSSEDGDGGRGVILPLLPEDVVEVAMKVGLPSAADDGASEEDAIGDGRVSVVFVIPTAASQVLNGVSSSEHGAGLLDSTDVLCFLPVPVNSSVPVSSQVAVPVCILPVISGFVDDEVCHLHPDSVSSSPSHAPLLDDDECRVGGGLVSEDGRLLRVAVGGLVREDDVVTLAARVALRP
ncbi:hypothetical protein Dimus_022464 [Dionaea muscipula]